MPRKKKEEDVLETPTIKYSPKEIEFIARDRARMATARNMRENAHDEFDGMTYSQRCEANRKGASAYIEPKKNKEDTNFVTGTTRQKLTLYLAVLNNLNIGSEVHAFDEKNLEDVTFGTALNDIKYKTEIIDSDDEKKMARQYVLLEQGEVFVKEKWQEFYENEKEMEVPFDGKNFDTVKWTERMKMISDGPSRSIVFNENVYLGDITIWGSTQKQPFIFDVEQIPYSEAKAIFGTWERWKYVSKDVRYWNFPQDAGLYNQNWSLTEVKKDHVEIVRRQSKRPNEIAIYINGVLMTPVGLPIPRKWGKGVEYDIEMQTLGMISPFFAYGRSVPMMMKVKQGILDEMLRLAILKTQKSFLPPYANMTGVHLSNRIFMPGKMTMGIDADRLKPLGDSKGVQRSEMDMIREIQKGMDDDSVSPIIQGKNPAGVSRITATQSQSMKQAADVLMNLTVFCAELLEIKIGNHRLWNILENWFDPVGQYVIDEEKKLLGNKYRTASVEKFIDGEGAGQSIVEVSEQSQDPMDIFRKEMEIEDTTGVPTRITVVNPNVVKASTYTYYLVAVHKPKKSSDLSKILFDEMFEKAKQFPNLNIDHMSERFARVWSEDPQKMFKKQSEMPTEDPNAPGGMAPGQDGKGARGSMFPKSMTEAGKPKMPKKTPSTIGE